MLWNEYLITHLLFLAVVVYFSNITNILSLWYLAGWYLFLLGLILFLEDGDIFVGFLWIIDLGVGLIFFIFILHFSNFLNNKTSINIYASRMFLFVPLIIFILFLLWFYNINSITISSFFNFTSWNFFVSWFDYYIFYHYRFITNLNLLREIYFYNNSFEFFIINFILVYGILIVIFLTFLIRKIFTINYLSQFKNFNLLKLPNSTFFIRNQNFIKQQNTSSGLRAWQKKKKISLT